MSAAIETNPPPRQVGVYRLEEKIGSGAMGTVYRATHLTLDKQVALKLVRAEDPEGETCQRFLLEGVAASRVRHPNAVEVLDAGIDGSNAYLAMQLLEGETLADCLRQQGRVPVTYAVDLFLPLCAALMAAHDAGVLHRDLKPANIFLADVGRGEPEPMLLDFGISKIVGPVDAELTQNPRFLGTPLYIAPEQADGAPGSPLSDQYSLALSLYECLLGVRPFEQHKDSLIKLLRHVAEGQIRPACELDASIPTELSDILDRALATDPSTRFGSMKELGGALLPFASSARATLWQNAFVNMERTMTSANAPISQTPSGRRVSVSLEQTPPPRTSSEPTLEADPDSEEFISHSKLFRELESAPTTDFDAARSTISRRSVGSSELSTRRTAGNELSTRNGPPAQRGWSPSHSDERPSRNSMGVLRPEPVSRRTQTGNRFVWGLSAVLGLTAVAGTSALLLHDLKASGQRRLDIKVRISPSNSLVELDEQPLGRGNFEATLPVDGRLHRLRISHPGYEPMTLVFRDSPPPTSVSLARQDSTDAHPSSSGDSNVLLSNGTSGQDSATATQPSLPVASPEQTKPREPIGSSAVGPSPSPAHPDPAHPRSVQKGKAQAETTQSRPAASVAADSEPTATPAVASPTQREEPRTPADPETPATSSPPQRSIRTGNLDPWAE